MYAVQIGEQSAVSLANRIYSSPSVLLYSTQRLAIAGPGVSADEITQTGLKYHFRYTGLRLLTRSGDRLFLIPVSWRKGRDLVYILRDTDDLRADVTTQ